MKKKDIIKIEQVEKKFSKSHVIKLEINNLEILRSKFLTAKLNPKSRYHPHVERTGENLQRGRILTLIKINRAATLMPLREPLKEIKAKNFLKNFLAPY